MLFRCPGNHSLSPRRRHEADRTDSPNDRNRNRLRGLRRDGGRNRPRHAIHDRLDPVRGHPALQDGPSDLRLLPARQDHRRLPVSRHRRRWPDRRRPAVPEDPGRDRLRPDRPARRRRQVPALLQCEGRHARGRLVQGLARRRGGGLQLRGEKGAKNKKIVYAIAGKTLPVIGRLEAGYFVGNKKALVNFAETDAGGNFKSDEKGILLSWDRTISEISDKLWAGVDYQGSDSGIGAFNFGLSWAFAKNVSIIFGYDIYN